jgi:predicted  nucleic acid-binding Zn-ribbon protein
MSQLQAILAYQEIDKRMFALERELAGSEERKEYVKLKKWLEAASEKLDALDAKAAALKTEAVELTKKYLATEEMLKDFENLDELVAGGADISFYKKKALSLMDKMKKIRAELNALEATIKATSEEYQKLKQQVIAAQKKYAEASERYKAKKASMEDERLAIEAELKKASAGISEELLATYKMKRKEKIFPVFGQLVSRRCPFCSMEPPLAAINQLSGGGTIECDHCHRIIYSE